MKLPAATLPNSPLSLPFFLLLLSAVCFPPARAQQRAGSHPPKAEVREVTDDYYGVKIVDPYRWMEDLKSDETQKWMRAQADYADDYLRKLPARAAFLKRLEELSGARNAVRGVRRVGDRLYYIRRAPGEGIGKVVMRGVAPGGAETTLVDMDKLSAGGGNYSVGEMSLSPDGKYLAYEIFSGGSEIGETRVLDVASGKDLPDRIGNGARPQAWLPDSKSFTYTRYEELPAGARPTQREEKKRVRLHALGADAGSDREIFGYGVNPEIDFPPVNSYAVTIPPGSKYAFGSVNPGVSPTSELYYAPLAALKTPAPIKWRKIAGSEDKIFTSGFGEYKVGVRADDELYFATTKGAPRGKVMRLTLKDPDPAAAEVVFASETEVVNNLRAAKDALYVLTIDGGNYKLRRVDYRTKMSRVIEVPAGGSVFDMNADAETDGLIFGTDSWVTPESFLSFNPGTNRLDDTRLTAAYQIDTADIEVKSVKARSHDGTLVPMVILHKKGLRLDGANPTLLDGYGAYGTNRLDPVFNSRTIAWLERGGVMAMAGVRGGGEYGEEWRLGGFQKTKPNTWKDFIACAEHLIANKYTAPPHLAGMGASAGGVLITNAIVTRPDLFAAAVSNVGGTNMLRLEAAPGGVTNVAEFGTVKTEEGFRALLGMDAYQKIQAGARYPAVLFTHGANDRRVAPWMSAKMAARLQAATASGKPVLLRINYDGGHFGGSNTRQENERQADIFAYLFEQLGADAAAFHRSSFGWVRRTHSNGNSKRNRRTENETTTFGRGDSSRVGIRRVRPGE